MENTNRLMAEKIDLSVGDKVLDLGCGYGSTARYIAENYGCHVTGTNISEKELALARERAKVAGLEHLLTFEYGDFHKLQYSDNSFEVVWSQEAFLHGADKAKILSECQRVLVPGGTLIFTDILVRTNTSQEDRARIYDRVKSPDIWDTSDYKEAIDKLGFEKLDVTDWSQYVAGSYGWVRDRLKEKRKALEPRIGKETVDNMVESLTFWVDSANASKIGWAMFLARKPS